ncbi:MAG: tetratricopeptide repeat protein [Pseudomonadota bacterium]
MLSTNWSEILKSDLDKLSPPASSIPGRAPAVLLKEGERRNITILFLDIQGFTAMSEKLDPEDVQLIIDNCFKILTHEVEKYQGYIDKYEGDRMMALFGSREASEQDCECALRAALGMKEKFVEMNKILAEREIRIGVRIGVNTGLVVTGRIGKGRDQDFTVMGDAVNLASRLESHAPPGEILIGEDARKAAGDGFLYESLGKIEVKGKSEPIPVYVVKGLNPARSERWERSPFTKRVEYVPRKKEDTRLLQAARELAGSHGIVSFSFAAPAGAGKSRLVYEFLRSYRTPSGEEPWIFRSTASTSHQMPYDLFAEPLTRLLGNTDVVSELFDAADPKEKSEGARLRPVVEFLAGRREPDERMRALDPATLRLEIHLAIRFVLARLASMAAVRKRIPLIVCFESIQWADHASIEALDFLSETLSDPSSAILLLWTYRPEFSPKPEWVSRFRIEEIVLPPLDSEACGKIVRSVLPGIAFSSREEKVLIERSAGNPFFLEELIQALIDDGVLSRDRDRWVLARPIEEASLPDSVQRVLIGRIDKLAREPKEMLMALSVIGEVIPAVVAEKVAGRMGFNAETTRQRLQALEDLGFILRVREAGVLGPQHQFRQSLTRDVVYSIILNHNKKILHGLVAESLEGIHGERAMEHAPILFHHFANAGRQEKTIEYGFAALDQFVRQNATREGLDAVRSLRELVRGWREAKEPRRFEERLRDAEIQLYDFLGQRKEQLVAIEELEQMAVEEPRPELLAKICWSRASYFFATGDFRQMKEQGVRGLSELGPGTAFPRLRMDLLRMVGIGCYSMGEHQEALDNYRLGLEIAERLDDRSAEGAFHNTVGLVHFNIGRAQEAIDYYEKANIIMRQIGDRRGVANTLGNRGLVHWTLGEYSKALEQLQESHAIFKEVGFRKGQAVTLGNIGIIHHKLGQYQEALRCYERALSLRREIRDRSGEGHDLENIGEVYMRLGDFKKALDHLDAGRWLAQEVGSSYLLAECLNNLAIVYRKMGEIEPSHLAKASEYSEEALRVASTHRLMAGEIKASTNLARIRALEGRRQEAMELSFRAMRLIEAHAAGVEGAEEDAFVNHYTLLHEAGRLEEARECLRKLVELIRSRADRIQEEEYRRSFLEEVRQNRFALEEWRKLNG